MSLEDVYSLWHHSNTRIPYLLRNLVADTQTKSLGKESQEVSDFMQQQWWVVSVIYLLEKHHSPLCIVTFKSLTQFVLLSGYWTIKATYWCFLRLMACIWHCIPLLQVLDYQILQVISLLINVRMGIRHITHQEEESYELQHVGNLLKLTSVDVYGKWKVS